MSAPLCLMSVDCAFLPKLCRVSSSLQFHQTCHLIFLLLLILATVRSTLYGLHLCYLDGYACTLGTFIFLHTGWLFRYFTYFLKPIFYCSWVRFFINFGYQLSNSYIACRESSGPQAFVFINCFFCCEDSHFL